MELPTVTRDNYADPEICRAYLSAGQYRAFRNCEYAALEYMRGNIRRTRAAGYATGRGLLMHAMMLDDAAEIARAKTDGGMLKTDGTLNANYSCVDGYVSSIRHNALAASMIPSDISRREIVKTGTISGMPYRIRMDGISDTGEIIDYKLVERGGYDSGESPAYTRGWWTEMAIFREIERQNSGITRPVVIIAVEASGSSDTPAVYVLNADADVLDEAINDVKKRTYRIQDVMNGAEQPDRCGRCDACNAYTNRYPRIRQLSEYVIRDTRKLND